MVFHSHKPCQDTNHPRFLVLFEVLDLAVKKTQNRGDTQIDLRSFGTASGPFDHSLVVGYQRVR
jgi:hypothetical protein